MHRNDSDDWHPMRGGGSKISRMWLYQLKTDMYQLNLTSSCIVWALPLQNSRWLRYLPETNMVQSWVISHKLSKSVIKKINNTAPKTSPILEVWLVFFPCKSLRLDVFLGSLHLCQWVLGLISSPSPFTTSELCSTLGIGIQGCLPANPTFAPRNRQPYSGTVNHDPGPFITAVFGPYF